MRRARQTMKKRKQIRRRTIKAIPYVVVDDGFRQRGAKTELKLVNGASLKNPAETIGRAIAEALDPVRAPGKVKSFADMTEAEREEMRRRYERK